MKTKLAILYLAALVSQSPGARAQSGDVVEAWRAEEFRQFDFWLGTWDVNLRTIQPDNSWRDSLQAKVEIYPILDGKAILELWDSPSIKGFSLRYFDPQKEKWVLYLNWPSNSQSSLGSLEGQFRHGRGEFFSGPPIAKTGEQLAGTISRYSFSDITPDSLRWDDAFSKDGGKTWTNNWVMEFSRSGARASWPAESVAHTFESGTRCQGESFDALNSMAGLWAGEAVVFQDAKESRHQASMKVYNILDGCSVLRFLSIDLGQGKTYRNFGLLTYNASKASFEELSLDNGPTSIARVHRGKLKEEQLALIAESSMHGQVTRFRHQWSLPSDEDQLQLRSASSSDGARWTPAVQLQLKRVDKLPAFQSDAELAEAAKRFALAINSTCPRSGKPISVDSLAEYRGRVVGFCNTHCRDDFAANIGQRPEDEEFFDKLIDAKLR